MFYAVNELCLALECIKIFVGHHFSGGDNWGFCASLGDLCACLNCVLVCCVVVWLMRWVLMFHVMVVIGDRPS